MPCYNCTSRVLRIFLQDSIAASISRPRLLQQHNYFRSQMPQQRFCLQTQVPFRVSQRLQSTLASGAATPPPNDDDYIPFGPPIAYTTNEHIPASEDGGLSGLPPPAPVPTPLQASHVADAYEPNVEILGLPEVEAESQVREAEAKRTIELIRQKIEASWARRSALHRSMAETGLPVVGALVDPLEDARSALSEEDKTGGCKKDKWKLPGIKVEAKRQAKREDKRKREVRKEEREQARELMNLTPAEARRKLKKMKRIEEGNWGVSKAIPDNPTQRLLKFKGGKFLEAKEEGKDGSLEVKGRGKTGAGGGMTVQGTVLVGLSRVPLPVVKESLPTSTKARVPSIRELIRDEKDLFDRKAFSRGRAEIREQSAQRSKVKEDLEQGQWRRKNKWELPPIHEVREPGTDQWDAREKLQHYVATTPKSKIEGWKVQKAALQKKFDKGWAPLKKLSPKARNWVKELHRSVPELTTERLSEIFMTSPEAIRRILSSKWTPSPEEEQDRERRWLKRQEKIWECWIDTGRVQTKGMKADTQKLKAENKEKWLKEKDEAFKQYLEKMKKARKEGSAILNSMKGLWQPSVKELYEDEPEFTDAGDMMAKEKYAQDLRKNMEKRRRKDREYRETLEKAQPSRAETPTPPEELPVESLANLSSRFI